MATQEQTQNNYDLVIRTGLRIWAGQRFVITNFVISDLSFLIRKQGNPTGNVTFTIRRETDDAILASKVLGDASILQGTDTWETATFDSSIVVDEEVRILCEFESGDASNHVVLRLQTPSTVASEYASWWSGVAWGNASEAYDAAYKFTYELGAAATVTTQAVTTIVTTTATGNGNVAGLGNTAVTQHGHCWNITGTPTTSDSKTTNGAKAATGAFMSSLIGLTEGTKYYVRAYAINSAGTSYGGEVVFWAGQGTVFPTDQEGDSDFAGLKRVTNLIHRYVRKTGVYLLEGNLGEVTSDFGLPEWLSEPISGVMKGTKEVAEEEARSAAEKARESWEERRKLIPDVEMPPEFVPPEYRVIPEPTGLPPMPVPGVTPEIALPGRTWTPEQEAAIAEVRAREPVKLSKEKQIARLTDAIRAGQQMLAGLKARLQTAPPAEKPGIQQQINVIQERLAQLGRDLVAIHMGY